MAGATTLLQESPTRAPEIAGSGSGNRLRWQEVAVAVAGFAALCVLVLTKTSAMLEPDDYAYQASIVALSHGQVVLSTAQYHALSRALGDGGTSIPQWVHLPDGRWISQKNPGYPFLAVAFYAVGALRVAPLFYGGLASVALFLGGRRWLGKWGGTVAVLLYCTSGAAITFAWRPTMETFTDASLVAAGAGLLLWTMLAVDASRRRRFLAGLGAFAALDAAAFTRYTDVVEVVVAVVVVLVFARGCRIGWRSVAGWMSMVVLLGVAVLTFDAAVYGAPLKTGYAAGLITFSLSAVAPNFAHMPVKLVEAIPMAVVAAVALFWILGRAAMPPRPAVPGASQELATPDGTNVTTRSRDAFVGLALAAAWLGIWGLYLGYTWTVDQAGADPVHVVRFYLPALGPIALLGAWALVRLPVVVWAAAVLALLGAGIASFHVLSAGGGPGVGRLGPGGPFGPGGAPGAGRSPGTGRSPGAGRSPGTGPPGTGGGPGSSNSPPSI